MEAKWADLLQGPLAKHLDAWAALKDISTRVTTACQSFYTHGQTNGELSKLIDDSTTNLLDTVSSKPYVMAFVGAPSAGVTTLVNGLIGVRAMVQGEGSPMSRIVELHSTKDVSTMRLELSDLDGSNAEPPLMLGEETAATLGKRVKDLVSAPDGQKIDAHWHERLVKIYFNFPTLPEHLVIVDIPSFRMFGGEDVLSHVSRYFHRYPPTCIGLVYDNPTVADAEVFAVDTLHNLLEDLPVELQPSMFMICAKFDVRGVSAGLGDTSSTSTAIPMTSTQITSGPKTSQDALTEIPLQSLQHTQFEEELAKAYQLFAERDLDGFTCPKSFKDCTQWAATSVRDFKLLSLKKNSPESPIVLSMWYRFMAHLQQMIVLGAQRRFNAALQRIGRVCGVFLQFTTQMTGVTAKQIEKYRQSAINKNIPTWQKRVSLSLQAIVKDAASQINKALKKTSTTHQKLIKSSSSFSLPGLDGQPLKGREGEALAMFRYKFEANMHIEFWKPLLKRLRSRINIRFAKLVDELTVESLGRNVALTDALKTNLVVLDPNSSPQFSSGGFSWTFFQQFQLAFSSLDEEAIIDAEWKRKRASMILERIRKDKQLTELVNADISQMTTSFIKDLHMRMEQFSRNAAGIEQLLSLGDIKPIECQFSVVEFYLWHCISILNSITNQTIITDPIDSALSFGNGWSLLRAKWILGIGQPCLNASITPGVPRDVMLQRFMESDLNETTMLEDVVRIHTTKGMGQVGWILEPIGFLEKDSPSSPSSSNSSEEHAKSVQTLVYPYAPSLFEINKLEHPQHIPLEDALASVGNLACLLLSFVSASGDDSHVPHLHTQNLFCTMVQGRRNIVWMPGLDKPATGVDVAGSAAQLIATRQLNELSSSSGSSSLSIPSSQSGGATSSSSSSSSSASSSSIALPTAIAQGSPSDPLKWAGKKPSTLVPLVYSNPEMASPRLASGRQAMSNERQSISPNFLNLPSPTSHTSESANPSYMTSFSLVIDVIAALSYTPGLTDQNKRAIWAPIRRTHKSPSDIISLLRSEEHLNRLREAVVSNQEAPLPSPSKGKGSTKSLRASPSK